MKRRFLMMVGLLMCMMVGATASASSLVVFDASGVGLTPGQTVDGLQPLKLEKGQTVTLIAANGTVFELSGPDENVSGKYYLHGSVKTLNNDGTYISPGLYDPNDMISGTYKVSGEKVIFVNPETDGPYTCKLKGVSLDCGGDTVYVKSDKPPKLGCNERKFFVAVMDSIKNDFPKPYSTYELKGSTGSNSAKLVGPGVCQMGVWWMNHRTGEQVEKDVVYDINVPVNKIRATLVQTSPGKPFSDIIPTIDSIFKEFDVNANSSRNKKKKNSFLNAKSRRSEFDSFVGAEFSNLSANVIVVGDYGTKKGYILFSSNPDADYQIRLRAEFKSNSGHMDFLDSIEINQAVKLSGTILQYETIRVPDYDWKDSYRMSKIIRRPVFKVKLK